jgi:TFIIF, beta subunit HTH domain
VCASSSINCLITTLPTHLLRPTRTFTYTSSNLKLHIYHLLYYCCYCLLSLTTAQGIAEIQLNKELAAAAAASAAGLGDIPLGKKEKLDRTELRSKLFVLFENVPRYTFKELNMRLNQPEEHLKSVSTCSLHCIYIFCSVRVSCQQELPKWCVCFEVAVPQLRCSSLRHGIGFEYLHTLSVLQ